MMTDLVGQFGSFGFALIAFVIALSIIVAVHEYGHYIVGRWTGIHAEVFSLGFGPVLWSGHDKRGTKWQVAALPFGGYVKFLGDANAASVGSSGDVAVADARRTMLGAPLWARALTVAAGPVFNFALSILIFFGIAVSQGQPVDPVRVGAFDAMPPSYVNELLPDDQLVAIDGIAVPELAALSDMLDTIPLEETLDYTVLRDGEEIVVRAAYPKAPIAQGLSPGSAAYDAGFEAGDVITSIDGREIFAFEQISEAVDGADGNDLAMQIWRDGEVVDIVVAPRRVDLPQEDGGFETRYLIGISGGAFFSLATEPAGIVESIGLAVSEVVGIMTSSLSGLYHMITGAISSCNLSGPVGIAQASGAMASQGATSFIMFVAVISTAVGLLNLFPIPVLDGGHLVFHAYEALTGRPPTENALRVLMAGGLSIILVLMVFALANDLILCP